MPHPRTKSPTGYPDAVRKTAHFLQDRYRDVGWELGPDLSERHFSDYRVILLVDGMNDRNAGTTLCPKYLLAITDTYAKSPRNDIDTNGAVSCLCLDALRSDDDCSAVLETLKRGGRS